MLSVRIGVALVGFGVLWMFIRDHLHMKRAAKPVNEPLKGRTTNSNLSPARPCRRTKSKLVRLPNRYHLPQKRNLQ